MTTGYHSQLYTYLRRQGFKRQESPSRRDRVAGLTYYHREYSIGDKGDRLTVLVELAPDSVHEIQANYGSVTACKQFSNLQSLAVALEEVITATEVSSGFSVKRS